MLLNYLLVALRHARKHRVYALLNLLGLTIAFAAFGLVMGYLHFETSFENFHSRADRIYRATYRELSGNEVHWARTYTDYINELPRDIPEVETLIRFQNQEQKYIRVGQEKFKPDHAFVTDANVFEVFDFPLLEGDPATALKEPYSVVLTESLARTYFGEAEAMGQTIQICGNFSPDEKSYKVTGVMADLPLHTHLPVDMLLSFRDSSERSWWAYVYVLLAEGSDIASVESKMPDFIKKYTDPESAARADFVFQHLPDIHLHSQLTREIVPNGNARNVQIFFFVGGFILLIAMINYLNLSSAMAMSRSREMGLRKGFGANSKQLIGHSLTESISFALIAAILALGLDWLILPWFEMLTGTNLILSPIGTAGAMALAAIVGGLLAGLHPALMLGAYRTLDLLRVHNSLPTRSGGKSFSLRRALVGLQFGLAILLLSGAAVAWSQFRYLQTKDLGMEKAQVLAIPNVPDKVTERFPLFRERVEKLPGVTSVAACMEVPSREIRDAGPLVVEGLHTDPTQAPMVDIQVMSPGFVETMGIEIIEGEDRSDRVPVADPPQFSETFTPDQYLSSSPRTYLINETAMKLLGWQSPSEAIGQQISWSIGNFQLAPGPITGVVLDFHQESMKNQIDPMLLVFEPIWLRTFLVKVETQELETTVSAIEAEWDQLYPSYPMTYHFLDELFDALYQRERVQLRILALLSGLAMFIALMGLFSLVAWSLRTRVRELALRRALGAGRRELVLLIGKEYAVVLMVAALVAIPLSYLWGRDWLAQFAYRTVLTPFPYLLTLALIGLLLATTIAFQTLRATSANPVDGLREG